MEKSPVRFDPMPVFLSGNGCARTRLEVELHLTSLIGVATQLIFPRGQMKNGF